MMINELEIKSAKSINELEIKSFDIILLYMVDPNVEISHLILN